MPPVTIRVLSDDPSPTPVSGVVVEFYNTGAIFQTGGTTNVMGEVQVTLPDATYDILFFKQGVSILPKQPQEIIVDSLLSNIFEVTAHVRSTPESIDPLRITISGYVKGVGGGPAATRLIFEPLKDALILSNNIIALDSRIEFTSDEAGYFEFELLRNTKYTAYFLWPQDLFGQQPGKLDVITWDGPAVALDALLFPIPINLEFSQSTITLPVSPTPDETVEMTLSFSDGTTRDTRSAFSTPWAGVTLTNTDNTIVEASILDGGVLTLKALTPGTATISTVREMATKVVIDPVPAYTTESIMVTVT